MKKAILNFVSGGMAWNSSRYLRAFYDPATGGPAGGGSPERDALLLEIRNQFNKELETRGFQNADAVAAALNDKLTGLDIEALRAFKVQDVNTSIRNLAAEVEKMKNQGAGAGGQKRNAIKEALDKNMTEIKSIFSTRGGNVDTARNITINVRAAAIMTTLNTIDETDVPDDILESFSLGEFIPKRYGRQYVFQIADRTTVQELGEYKTWLEEGSIEGAFAIIAESGLKPLVSVGLVRNVAVTKKVAGKYVVTEEFAKFRKNAYAIIRNIIRDKLIRDYSALVTTDLQAQAAGYVGTTLDGTFTAPNDYDAIGAVAAQISTLNFIPDVLVLNPQDAWRIRLAKDDEGRYLFPVVTENGTTKIFTFDLVESTYQTAGTFTLGESGLFKIEEEGLTIRIGYGITMNGATPEADFDYNRFRVIVELFFRDYIATNHLGSFVTATFASVKTALTVTP